MKKYFIFSLLISVLITTVFAFGVLVPSASAVTTTATSVMTVSQFIEMLITIGAIAPDKIVAARAVATQLSIATTSVPTTATSYLQVLSPNGAESWSMDVDVAYNITWGATGQLPVTVSLVPAKGASCDLTAMPIVSKNGNNSLAVKLKTALCYNQATGSSTPLKDGSYKVRVAYNVGTTTLVKDESNATFKITPILIPSLKVTYPNGGESLIRNNDYVVKYKLTNAPVDNSGLIYLKLLDNNGNTVFNSKKLVNSAGTYDLELSSSLTPGAYKIKMNMTTSKKVEIEDISDNFFWVSSSL